MSHFSHYEACPKCTDKGRDNRRDNLARYKDGSGHCFSCGHHMFTKHYIKHEVKEEINVKSLPADFSREIPARAWQWLLQYGLGYKYWQPHVGWSEKDSRLVFTVAGEFSIGRYIPGPEVSVAIPESESAQRSGSAKDDHKPRKWHFWGDGHKTPHVLGDYLQSKRVVLVEDIVSAHKVGKVSSSICLFGTNIFPGCIPVLRHIGLPITIWLDQDQQGTVQKKAANLSVLTGLPVSYTFTELDPKCLSFEQIEKVLE